MKKISIYDLKENPFDLIGRQWILITSWNKNELNAMTASWGGLGVLWGKNVAFCFVRKSRYTFKLLENSKFASLCFLKSEDKNILKFCGEKSGRDIDKIKKVGLRVINDENFKYFEQSKLVFCCKKIYSGFLENSDFNKDIILKNYLNKDFHKMFVFEIEKIFSQIISD